MEYITLYLLKIVYNINMKITNISYLQVVQTAFEQEAYQGNTDRLLLSVAVGGGEDRVNKSYNIQEISK